MPLQRLGDKQYYLGIFFKVRLKIIAKYSVSYFKPHYSLIFVNQFLPCLFTFKANWYKAEQYCRFHGMHLASINTAEEQQDLQDHIQAYGKYSVIPNIDICHGR